MFQKEHFFLKAKLANFKVLNMFNVQSIHSLASKSSDWSKFGKLPSALSPNFLFLVPLPKALHTIPNYEGSSIGSAVSCSINWTFQVLTYNTGIRSMLFSHCLDPRKTSLVYSLILLHMMGESHLEAFRAVPPTPAGLPQTQESTPIIALKDLPELRKPSSW